MELFSSPDAYFYFFLITSLAVLPAFYLYLTWNFDYWKKRGIPGRKPRLFMGTFTPPWIWSVEKQDLDCFQKFGRTHGGFEGRRPVLFTSDPEIIRLVTVKDFNAFPNRRSIAGTNKNKYARQMVSALKDDDWKLLRNVMTPAYTSGKLKQMVYLIEECVSNLIQRINVKVDNNESIEMTEYFTVLSLEIIASCAFGIKIDDIQNVQSEFVKKARKTFRPAPILSYITMIFPAIFDYLPFSVLPDPFSYFADVANKTIDMRLLNKESHRRDVLEILLDAEIPDNCDSADLNHSETLNTKKKLSRDSIIAQTILFLLAGNETTSITLSNVALELAQHPAVQEKLIKEVDSAMNDCNGKLTYETVVGMQYLEMVLSETFRHLIPGYRLERECDKDGYKINGTTIDRGTLLYIPLFALYNDPEYYPNPEIFDPERFSSKNKAKRNPFTFIPFGVGPRNCIAMRFALLELKITLVYLLSKFRFQTSEKTEIPIKYFYSPLLRLPISINLKLEKRTDQSLNSLNGVDD